ncbi:hypothetical protein KCP70_22955 [Salmonella enterica subsp. enterica]|nr:hypothetical protein KCP70_22955 [Salmonella enterica subsp. enterica]
MGTFGFLFLRRLGVHGGAESWSLSYSGRPDSLMPGEQQQCRRMTEHRICRCIHLSFLQFFRWLVAHYHEESDGGQSQGYGITRVRDGSGERSRPHQSPSRNPTTSATSPSEQRLTTLAAAAAPFQQSSGRTFECRG